MVAATPRWVRAILEWRWTWSVIRLGLAGSYLIGGMTKLLNFQAAIAEQTRFGLEPAVLWATLAVVVETGGSALLIAGRAVWLAGGALGVLTAIAILVANNFWAMEGDARFMAMNAFFEHLGLIAGLALAAKVAASEEAVRREKPIR